MPNAFSQLVQQKRVAGVSLLDLTVSNPTEVFSDYPHAAIGRAFAHISDFTYRPDPFGRSEARLAIAQYYAERQITISPDQLFLTASTSEAYALLFKLFCNPGDEILAPLPSYPLFEYLAGCEAVRILPYRLLYDGSWFIDFTDLRERISPRTRAIVIVNPNNPTGSFLKGLDLEMLAAIGRERKLPLISDEVFMDYPLGPQSDRVETLVGNDSVLSFSLNGLSKCAGMPQMKLAWIAINGPVPERGLARDRLELLLDTYLSVNTPVQCALPELLQIGAGIRRQIAGRIKQNLGSLQDLLRDSPAHCMHTEGGWSALIQLPRTLSEELWIRRLLEERGVVIQPGYFFDLASEAYVVVSLITPPDIFTQGIRELRELVGSA